MPHTVLHPRWTASPRLLRRLARRVAAGAPAATIASLTLYTHPASRGKIVEWYVAELGGAEALELQVQTVDMLAGEHKQPPFLQVNPFGKLPALSDGRTHVFESGAILLYLHDKFEAPSFDARPDFLAARGRAAAWVLFANSTLGNGLYLQHLRDKEAPGLLGGLQAILAKQPYLEKDGFSVGDIAVGGLLLYLPMMIPSLSLEPYPAVQAYCARLAARKAYRATLGARIAGAADGSAPPAPPTRGGLPQES